jgi:hypothetical protein
MLPASAPVFAVGPEAQDGAQMIRDVALATAGYSLLASVAGASPSPPAVEAIPTALGSSLERLTAETISQRAGVSFDTASAGLETWKSIAAGQAAPLPAVLADPGSVEALRQSVSETISGVIGDVPARPVRTLEDDAQELLSRAGELAAGEGGQELAEGLREIAHDLLQHASLVVVTDAENRPFLANGAVQTLGLQALAANTSRSVEDFVVDLLRDTPSAAATTQLDETPTSSNGGGTWFSTPVPADPGQGAAGGGDVLGYVHALRPDTARQLTKAALNELRGALPKIALQTGLLLYGDESKRREYRKAVQSLVDDCRILLK